MFQFFETTTLSRKAKLCAKLQLGLLEVKSKFDAEFRRFSLDPNKTMTLDDFQRLVREVHRLRDIPFFLTYTDPEGDLLPISNEENFARALRVSRPVLRLVVQHRGNNQFDVNGYGAQPRRNIISRIFEGEIPGARTHNPPPKRIGKPENFRCVSAIIDVDVLPETQRRVKLIQSDRNTPLGFYIRDGYNIYTTPAGVEKVYGFFISKLSPGGLAAGTGLLAVNDEILEVNGIEVAGKTLDQVTDMMVANSSNLIITTKPFNQYSKVMVLEDNISNLKSHNNVSKMADEDINDGREEDDDDDDDDIREFIRQDPSGSSNTEMESRLINSCKIDFETVANDICINNNIQNAYTIQQSQENSFSTPGSRTNLGLKTKSGQLIHDLQSLSNMQGSHENLIFTEANQNFSVNNDCSSFLSTKSNNFFNFTNSSLRTHGKPSSAARELNRRISSCSVDHRATDRRHV